MSCDPDNPSHYHLLRRLISLCYRSPPRTAYFYAAVLYDLYHADLITGLSLPVAVRSGKDDEQEDMIQANQWPGKQTVEHGRKNGSSTKVNQDASTGPHQVEVEWVHVPRHLALHVRGWSLINNSEFYSAVHLVKDHVDEQDSDRTKALDLKDLDTVPDLTDLMDSEDSDHDDESKRGQRQQTQRSRPSESSHKTTRKGLPCLECAMIHSTACERLARYDEGRTVLQRTVSTLQSSLDEAAYGESLSFFSVSRLTLLTT